MDELNIDTEWVEANMLFHTGPHMRFYVVDDHLLEARHDEFDGKWDLVEVFTQYDFEGPAEQCYELHVEEFDDLDEVGHFIDTVILGEAA